MLRFILLFGLTLLAPTAFAYSLPNFFTPVPNDLSMYYLGAIFGNHLIPTGSDIHLASWMFEIFNQIALTVGLCIVTYTIITGTLSTAAEGEPLGKDVNTMWTPIRMSLGMAMLVPKAGTGYSMVQYLVVWMISQGVGAADTLWSHMLDYFIEGGAVRAVADDAKTDNNQSTAKNKDTVDQTYEIEDLILINTTCVEAHNLDEARREIMGEYKIYTVEDNSAINFGNPNPSVGGDAAHACGKIDIKRIEDVKPEHYVIYANLFLNMATNLSRTGKMLAGEQSTDEWTQYEEWLKYFPAYRDSASYFIDGLIGYASILFPQSNNMNTGRDYLEPLKNQGWLLAGNYYRLLMSLDDQMKAGVITIPKPKEGDEHFVEAPNAESETAYKIALDTAVAYHGDPNNHEEVLNFAHWGVKYDMPGYSASGSTNTSRKVSYDQINDTARNAFRGGDIQAGLSAYGHAHGEMAKLTMAGVGNTGTTMTAGETDLNQGNVIRNPIIRAAEYGKYLTQSALALLFIAGPIFIALAALSICSASAPVFAVSFVSSMVFLPLIYGAVAMMYLEGVMLGVYLPLIPMITFAIGGIGWMMAAIESVTAAPLIAIGVIFPDTRSNLLGRAEPAVMMMLNLMLRPALMVTGFGFAMMLTWVTVELINIMFVTFTESVVQIDSTFGPLVVTMAYAATLIVVVDKVFGLINVLPDTTLKWIGDTSMAHEGAEKQLRAAETASREGGGTGRGMAGGLQPMGSAMYQEGRAKQHREESAKLGAGKSSE